MEIDSGKTCRARLPCGIESVSDRASCCRSCWCWLAGWLAACRLAGIEPRFIEYAGDDVTGFIIGQNIHRRHLDESQRAMVAARLATLQHGANQYSTKEEGQICPSTTQPEAADLLNVGRLAGGWSASRLVGWGWVGCAVLARKRDP